MKRGILAVLILAAMAPVALKAQQPVYLDPSQPISKRVADLISRLTLPEKASLMSTTAPAIPRLKIPAMNGWNQSLHGIVWTQPTTMFPVPIAMAATWDSGLVEQTASAIADEGRAVYNLWPKVSGKTVPGIMGQSITIAPDGKRYAHNGLIYRSPVINMVRDPHWGRVWETFGEDPILAARMTVAYVKGTQGNDPKYLELGATVKHYAVYDQEIDRHILSAQVDAAMVQDYYMPQFKAGIMAGKSISIMSSYNEVNGVPNAINKWLLVDILRGQWGFPGILVPDSGAVNSLVTDTRIYKTLDEAAAKTVLAGTDLDNGAYAEVLPQAVKEGYLTEADLDKALRRVLTVRFRLGEFDPPSMVPFSKIPPSDIDSPAHRDLALRMARESIVLLTNRNHFLPLDPGKLKTIAVIGPFADYAQTGPNYTGQYSKFVKPLDGIRNAVGTSVQVLYARGSGILETDNPQQSVTEAVDAAKKADVAVLFVGTNQTTEREGIDRNSLDLPAVQLQLVRAVTSANPNSVIVLMNGGPITLPLARPGMAPSPFFRRSIDTPALLDMFWDGEEGGTAIADVLFGKYSPAGRLPYTVYASETQLPPRSQYDIAKGFTYMYLRGKPEYAFGHGLSYTTFSYSNLSLSSSHISANGTVTVKVDVQNTGKRAGDEVAQLYVHGPGIGEWQPEEQLEGFDRVRLKPGETKTVTFPLPVEQLASWDMSTHRFAVKAGAYDIMVGSASDDIRQKAELQITTPGAWPPSELTTRVSDLNISSPSE
ncbi:MAG TPA: glycoside hydrolase family 3 C-terminal domain-containing protein [Terriglobia bacterium]|nr:glycoside hydrolase family 3 C-terminal domain-containing protein [Terriglobia bacterium]